MNETKWPHLFKYKQLEPWCPKIRDNLIRCMKAHGLSSNQIKNIFKYWYMVRLEFGPSPVERERAKHGRKK